MRVLHVMSELQASGAETMLEAAAPWWAVHGVDCDVVATGREVGRFAVRLRDAGYVVHHLPFHGDLAFLRDYARLVRSGGYDVVHVHAERAFVYLCAAARLSGARTVRTVHNSFPFEGRLARRRSWQRRLTSWLGTRFVAVGRTVAANELERFGNRAEVIDNWIDVDRFVPPTIGERAAARTNLGVSPETVVLVSVGNCRPVKNHAALLEALAGLSDDGWVFLHVGQEDPKGTERRLAGELGIEFRCRFLGQVDPLEALHAADLYVMPSLYEGLPIATLEALSTGVSGVLTDVPGNRDLRGLSPRTIWTRTDAASLRVGLTDGLAAARAADEDAAVTQHDRVAKRFSPAAGVAAYAAIYRGYPVDQSPGRGGSSSRLAS